MKTSRLFTTLLSFRLLFLCIAPLQAQQASPAVPAEYAGLYSTMQGNLDSFTQTLNAGWNGTKSPMQFSGELYPATSVGGINAPASDYFQTSIIPYLNSLQAVGITTVKFSINFPILYQPYYNSAAGANNPAAYQGTLNFYKQVVTELRRRGMKVVIPTQVVFPFEYATTTPYFKTLTFAQYSAGRSAVAQTIARELQPDYLLVQSEPVTEVGNTPPNISTSLSNMTTNMQMVSGILSDLQKSGLHTKSLLVGAGMGTWQPQFTNYLNAFVALPMDVLDVHVYPINKLDAADDYLQRILQMADAAHAHNMRVCMGECWLNKESNSELNAAYSPVVPARSVYSFWQPLDQEFLYDMAAVGYWKKFDFIDPFYTSYFFSYLDYNQMQPFISGKTSTAAANILQDYEDTASYGSILAKTTTGTGNYYSLLIQNGASSGTKP